ncbi:hypothetical protein PNA2_1919 [Pyrococcus sp. NA2]|nr:hypothetical protein PNA2_1919 [Pyrococcus sp. NA2]
MKRGFLLNSTVIILLIPLILLVATYEDVSSFIIKSQGERIHIRTTKDVVVFLNLDFERTLEISAKRAIVTVVDYVSLTGNFIDPSYKVNNTIADLIKTGRSPSIAGYNPDRIMKGQTIGSWLSNVSSLLKRQGYELLPDINTILRNTEIKVAPLDAFRVVVKGRILNITIRDKSGKIVYSGPIPRDNGYIYSIVDITELEDPLFSAMTGGRYHRSIRACKYSYPSLGMIPLTVANGSGRGSNVVIGKFGIDLQYNLTHIWDSIGNYITNLTINGIEATTDMIIMNSSDMGVIVFNGSIGTTGWCSNYKYRINVTIRNNLNKKLVDFQVPISISISSKDMPLTPKIKVYNSDCVQIPFWVEKWIKQGNMLNAVIWVKLNLVPGDNIISIYFDPEAPENWGNPQEVFEFYDDFETWEDWSTYKKGKVTQSSDVSYYGHYSLKKYSKNDPNGGYKLIGKELGRDIILEGYVYRPRNWGGGSADRIGIEDDNFNGYSIFVSHTRNVIRIDKRTNGNPSSIFGSQGHWNPPEDDWYFFRLIIADDAIILEIYDKDSSYKYTIGVGYLIRVRALDNTYSRFDRVVIHGGYVYYVDSIRIRKYATQMPTVFVSSKIETIPQLSQPTIPGRVYDIQPLIACLLDNRYFAIRNGWSFFERLEGSNRNHIIYEKLANETQDELGITYNGRHYPIGLVSFMIPHGAYDNKLLNVMDMLGISIEEGESSTDYYFLQYYFGNGVKVEGYRVWGISYGDSSSTGNLENIPFFIDPETAKEIFGIQGACDLLYGYNCS